MLKASSDMEVQLFSSLSTKSHPLLLASGFAHLELREYIEENELTGITESSIWSANGQKETAQIPEFS